ncbi:MAG: 2-amino-4-hydroxy-6-hydroxymethyldihydropteridine diphosphokinase [Muribaculaceae bacterium]
MNQNAYTVVLSIGSNTRNSQEMIDRCVQWLGSSFVLIACASVYSTPAINGKDADYLNTVAVIASSLPMVELSAMFKDYEKQCGRTPESKLLGAIPIDIDIVVWNGDVVRPRDYCQEYFQIGWREIASKNV